jgi:hypothetical protein
VNNSFARIPFLILCRFHELTRNEIVVFCNLAAHRNAQTGLCNPLQKTIAKETGLNKTRISEAVAGLVSKEWIQVQNGNFCLLVLTSEVTENVTESYGKRNSEVTENVTESYGKRNSEVTENVTEVTENVTESYGKRNSPYKEEQTIEQRERTEREPRAPAQENFRGESFDEPTNAELQFYEKCLNGLKVRFKTPIRLKNETEWLKPISFWWENEASAEDLLEIFDVKNEIRERKHETWQMTPRILESCFGTLEALKIELERVKNGVEKNAKSNGNFNRKRTPAEVILSRDFSRYDAPFDKNG